MNECVAALPQWFMLVTLMGGWIGLWRFNLQIVAAKKIMIRPLGFRPASDACCVVGNSKKMFTGWISWISKGGAIRFC